MAKTRSSKSKSGQPSSRSKATAGSRFLLLALGGSAFVVLLTGVLIWWIVAAKTAAKTREPLGAAGGNVALSASPPNWQELVAQVANGPAEQRRAAAKMLAASKFAESEEAIRALGSLLGETDLELQQSAVHALSPAVRDPGQAGVRTTLLSMLSVAQPPAVDAAIQNFIVQEAQAFLPVLLDRLQKTTGTQDAAVYPLVAMLPRIDPASPAVTSALIHELSEVGTHSINTNVPNPVGAIASRQELTTVNQTYFDALVNAISQLEESQIPRLIEAFPGDERGIETALIRMGPRVMPACIADLEAGRLRCLSLVMEFGPAAKDAVGVLMKAFDDPRTQGYTSQFCQALGRIGPAALPAEDRIATLLKESEDRGAVNPIFAQALCRLRGPKMGEGIRCLKRVLTETYRAGDVNYPQFTSDLRLIAAETLGEIDDPAIEVEETLLLVTRDESSPPIQLTCAEVLIRRKSRHQEEALQVIARLLASTGQTFEERHEVLKRITRLGTLAKPLGKDLIPLLRHPQFGAAASGALKAVDPELAKQQGIL